MRPFGSLESGLNQKPIFHMKKELFLQDDEIEQAMLAV